MSNADYEHSDAGRMLDASFLSEVCGETLEEFSSGFPHIFDERSSGHWLGHGGRLSGPHLPAVIVAGLDRSPHSSRLTPIRSVHFKPFISPGLPSVPR